MKTLFAFAFCLLPFVFFGQESVSFYFENNKSALIYTIENQNLQLMKYLINKKVNISSNVQIDEGNKIYETFANYQKTFSKKFKM